MNIIENGGVASPRGFKASGVACGIKKNKKDLAIVCSDEIAVAAGVFTNNVVKGHSLKLTMQHTKTGYAKAIIINSGNANACVGEQGDNDAKEMAELSASLLDCDIQNILIGSTGVIGTPLNMSKIRAGIRSGVNELSNSGGNDAASAIMTTDIVVKEMAVELEIQGERITIGGMAKGSGMVHPNMATMISIITTDANISRGLLDRALKEVNKRTFNRISVDGETSVCDMVLMLANGEANNNGIVKEDEEYKNFVYALEKVCISLSKAIAKDGEGATKLIEVSVTGALNEEDALKVVSSVAKSPLVKTAMFGKDANWGRIFTAVGYSGADFDPNLTDITISDLMVCRNGCAIEFDEKKAKDILTKPEIFIKIDLKRGSFADKMWTCDFSTDYIKINSNYRS